MMKREEQLKLLDAAQERLRSRVSNWLKVPSVKAAVHRKPEKTDDHRPLPQQRRRRACA